jgi:hypothetical protein
LLNLWEIYGFYESEDPSGVPSDSKLACPRKAARK